MKPKPVPRSWSDALHLWESSARASGQPQTTIKTRRQHLGQLARAFPHGPESVDVAGLLRFVGQHDWATETRRGRYATYRVFFSCCAEHGLIASSPAAKLPRVKPGQARPRPVPDDVYADAVLTVPPRERVMMRLAAEAGLRRAEVAVVHVSRDMERDLGGWSLRVHGKGDKVRVVPLPASLAIELRQRGPGFAFPGDDGGHLSPRWVGKLVTNALPDGWTMHTLRHRFATRAYAHERDTFVVQELLGHASPATTRRYVKITSDALRRTVESLAA